MKKKIILGLIWSMSFTHGKAEEIDVEAKGDNHRVHTKEDEIIIYQDGKCDTDGEASKKQDSKSKKKENRKKKSADIESTDAYLNNIRKVEIYSQLLPVLIKPSQAIALLPKLKDIQKKVDLEKQKEDAALKSFSQEVKQAVELSEKSNQVPEKSLIDRLKKQFLTFRENQHKLAMMNAEEMFALLKNTLEPWQIKVITHVVSYPNLKGEKISDDEKLRTFVKDIILDPLSFDYFKDLASKERL